MARSERKELRLTPEMVGRIDGARGDVSFNRFVERALESALTNLADVGESKVGDRGGLSASSRASERIELADGRAMHKAAMSRQAKLNAAKAGKR